MFTTNPNDSCLSFCTINIKNKDEMLGAISNILNLKKDKDVIIVSDHIDIQIYNEAKLYLEVFQKPIGLPTFVDICSAKLNSFIFDFESFLRKLAIELKSEIFIDQNNKGFIITPSNEIRIVDYDFVYIEEEECIIIRSNKKIDE